MDNQTGLVRPRFSCARTCQVLDLAKVVAFSCIYFKLARHYFSLVCRCLSDVLIGRMCVCLFGGEGAYVYVTVYIYIVFLEKKRRIFFYPASKIACSRKLIFYLLYLDLGKIDRN